jgi:hypothetical protein
VASNQVTITLRPKFDTEALEMMRVYHLRQAEEIYQLIGRLSQLPSDEDEDDANSSEENL